MATPLVVGLVWGTRVAGGADSFGYVSQAIQWSTLDIQPQRPVIRRAPWPNAAATFTPIGYSTTLDGKRIVPTYPPGLPLLMSAPYRLAGLAGVYLVVPLLGALAVFLTYRLGLRVSSRGVALSAALLLAASPIFLHQVVQPVSDVPVTAPWIAALLAAVLATSTAGERSAKAWRRAALSGLAAALAILIRPNLAPLALVVGGYLLWRTRSLAGPPLAFAAGLLPGVGAVAALHTYWYGSVLLSGYGSLSELFSLSPVPANFWNYLAWLGASQSPLIFLGLLAPALRWPEPQTAHEKSVRWLLIAFAMTNLALYLPYFAFDDWSYLRFLLPSLPVWLVLLGDVLDRGARRLQRSWILFSLVLLVGAFGFSQAVQRGAFEVWKFEARYPAVAEMVLRHCGKETVVVSMQHSGSLRFYAGVQTLRWDAMEPRRIERALAWLERSGHPVCFALEPWEIEQFDKRFAATPYAPLAALEVAQTHDVRLFKPR